MTKSNTSAQQILQAILSAEHITLVSHIRPDGDAVGSLIGMGLALRACGKDVFFAFEETLPQRFRFMENSTEKGARPAESLLIALDCADQKRMPKHFHEINMDVNIDHHATNELFAAMNFVDRTAAATAEMIADLLKMWNMPIPVQAANALLLGIITDTIGFRTPNTTPHTLRTAAVLMEKGANLTDMYQQALTDVSWEASILWGMALNKLQKDGNIIYTVITCEDRQKSGFIGRDDADLTNFLSSIQDADVSILFNQQDENSVKVSWRSRTDVNVAKIAAEFGGGGHPAAAGAEIELPLQITQQKVLDVTKTCMRNTI